MYGAQSTLPPILLLAAYSLAGVVLFGSLNSCSGSAGKAATELRQLEEDFYTMVGDLNEKEVYPTFQPRFDAFAKKYPGTQEALTAKLRLLELTVFLAGNAGTKAADAVTDEIFSEYPHSEELERILDFWFKFDDVKLAGYLKRLTDPAQPDRVRASVALQYARTFCAGNKLEKAKPYLDELLGKYRDTPRGYTTYGAIADALSSPHNESALAIGRTAPEIVGSDVDGKTIKLSALRGKVVVVNFFGDW